MGLSAFSIANAQGPDNSESAIDKPQQKTAVPGEEFYVPLGTVPAWIGEGDHLDAENQIEYLVVQSGKCLRRREAEEELDERLVETVWQKVDEWFAPGAAATIGVDRNYIYENLLVPKGGDDRPYHIQAWQWKVPEENIDMVEAEMGDSWQCSALVQLDREFETWARSRWEDQLVRSRTLQLGLMALSGIILITLAFGYFTANHKTRGFYSRRLQTLALILFLVLVAIAVLLSGMFTWL